MLDGMGTASDAGDVPTGRGRTPHLPEPTGPYPAGTVSLFKDVPTVFSGHARRNGNPAARGAGRAR